MVGTTLKRAAVLVLAVGVLGGVVLQACMATQKEEAYTSVKGQPGPMPVPTAAGSGSAEAGYGLKPPHFMGASKAAPVQYPMEPPPAPQPAKPKPSMGSPQP